MKTGIPNSIPLPTQIRRKSYLWGGVHALILISFFVLVEVTIYSVLERRINSEMDETQRLEMKLMEARLTSLITRQENEFLMFAWSSPARQCVLGQTAETCSTALSFMHTMLRVNPHLDHVRLFSPDGDEIVRVNRSPNGGSVTVAPHQLQNKRDRDYFIQSMATGKNRIYVSRLDLNVENGVIESPLKPVLRFGKAVYSPDGTVAGVAVANYRTRPLLVQLEDSLLHPEDYWYLLDESGYYLRSKNPQKEFSFMYPHRRQVGFFTDFPQAWQSFQISPNAALLDANGKFYFKKVSVTQPSRRLVNAPSWILVMHVPTSALVRSQKLLSMGLSIGAVLLCPLLAVLGWKTGRSQVRQAWYLGELAKNAVTDHLTGLLNHRGLLEKLSPAVAVANRRNSPLVLIFVDLNDLKNLNDQMGHKMGDRLIQSAANAFVQTVRETDIVGRIGGDEFVAGLLDCDLHEAVLVMHRVESAFAKMGIVETGVPWTMSWGCTQRLIGDTAEQMISRADQQMYFQKRAYKTGGHRVSGPMEHNA